MSSSVWLAEAIPVQLVASNTMMAYHTFSLMHCLKKICCRWLEETLGNHAQIEKNWSHPLKAELYWGNTSCAAQTQECQKKINVYLQGARFPRSCSGFKPTAELNHNHTCQSSYLSEWHTAEFRHLKTITILTLWWSFSTALQLKQLADYFTET